MGYKLSTTGTCTACTVKDSLGNCISRILEETAEVYNTTDVIVEETFVQKSEDTKSSFSTLSIYSAAIVAFALGGMLLFKRKSPIQIS